MKKHLALVLALVMVLSSFSFVSAAPDFSDMEGHENAEAVARLELLNVLKGYPDGTFKPDNTITRAEFAAVAVRVSGLENVAMAAQGLPTGFTDVPAHHWASGYVGTAAKMGIVNGIGNGLFAPETPVKYEEAITMIVRALGYEPMAQARGGYPFGYLIVANEIDLLEDAMGTQGTWATRAFVAQITDNALEIPMMIQVGFGSDTKWVISGEEDTKEKWLLDQMGFEVVEGVVEVKDVADMEIEIDGDDYVVPAGFDFFMTEGAEIKAWVDGDDVIAYTINDDVYIDAVEFDGDEITLVTADKDYDITRDVDDKFANDFTAEFAKIVVNGDGDVSFVEAYDFSGFILVEEIDDEMILDMNDDEVDVEDYVVIKDNKTVSADDLVEGDVVFYVDEDVLGGEYDGLAIAYNESEVGEISRVYKATRAFRMDGVNYTLVDDAMYLDDAGLSTISDDVEELEWMMDEETEVEAFMNLEGDVVLVVGDTGEAATSKFYAVLDADATAYDGRGGNMLALDLFNEFGEKVELDLTEKFIKDGDFDYSDLTVTTTGAITEDLAKVLDLDGTNNFLFEVEVEDDGDLKSLTYLKTYALNASEGADIGFEIDDTYAEVELTADSYTDHRLMSSTVVFYDHDGNDFNEVITIDAIDDEFTEVEEGFAFVKNGRVEVALATATDADSDTATYTGLVKTVRTYRDDTQEITVVVAGEEMEFTTTDDSNVNGTIEEGYFWKFVVGNNSMEIENADKANLITNTVYKVDGDKIVLTSEDGPEIELTDNAKVYKYEDENDNGIATYSEYSNSSLRNVEAGDSISYVYARSNSTYWVSYVVINVAPAPSTADTLVYTSGTAITVNNVEKDAKYTLRVKTAGTSVQTLGDTGFTASATNGNVVNLASSVADAMEDSITYTVELYKTADLTKVLASYNFTVTGK